MAKTRQVPGASKKYKERGRVKLQPRPSQARLKRGDDELMAELISQAVRKKDRGGVKLQPKPKPSGVKRGGDEALLVRFSYKPGKKKTTARKKAGGKKKTVRKMAGKK